MMRKLLIFACVLLLVSCVAKRPVVKTEGLEEVVVFGEDTSNVSEETVLPLPVAPPLETALPTEEIAPPAAVVTPPPLEEVITPPPISEVTLPSAPVEEVVVPPPITGIVPPVEEVMPLPPPVVTAPPLEEVTLAPPTVPSVLEEGMPTTSVTARPPSVAPNQVFGFRVQIFASSTEKNANRVADDARSPFGGKVYIEHVAPYYKVRVGNCLTENEAQVIKAKAISLGFKGAFVVETMISP